MGKAILLCRVSTDAQDYEAQIRDLKEYARSKGITECHVISSKESGFKNIHDRESWTKTTDYFESHPDYDTLIVTEISRLGRLETAIAEIKEYLARNKKSLFIKDLNLQPFDKGKKNPEADIVFSIYASMATSEMSIKKDRFMRSKKNLNEQGYSIVGKVLFGYKRVRDEVKGKNKFVVNEKEAREIKELYNIYLNGLDGRDIGIKGLVMYAVSKGMSKYLHSKRNMTKMLSEIAYIGGIKEVRIKRKNPEYWVYNDRLKPQYKETVSHIPYPAIISKSLYEAAQQRKLDNRILVDKSVKHETILSKLIECPVCHTSLMGDYRKGTQQASYRCAKHKGTSKCSNSSIISMQYLDSLVWCYLKSNVKNIIEEIAKKNNEDLIFSIENEINNCLEKRKSILDEEKTFTAIFKNEVRILGLEEASAKYDKATSKLAKQVNDIDAVIDAKKRRITEIKELSSTILSDEDMDKVERDKKMICQYIHLLVSKVIVHNYRTCTIVRIILNGDDDKTFRCIFADKRDNRITAYGLKRVKDMPFSVINKDVKGIDGSHIGWVDPVKDIIEKMYLNDGKGLEVYPIEYKRLEVYDEDLKTTI